MPEWLVKTIAIYQYDDDDDDDAGIDVCCYVRFKGDGVEDDMLVQTFMLADRTLQLITVT